MRGLWKVALLAPALALVSADWIVEDFQDQIITSTSIKVPIPGLSESPDAFTFLDFRVEVLASQQICGYGNLTVNGQELAQQSAEFSSIGRGSLDVDGKTVEGSWAFFCLNGAYGPYAQRLDFSVASVDGKFVEDVAFWVEFKQSEGHGIFSTSSMDEDSSSWEDLPEPEESIYDMNIETFDLEGELAELNWMKELVQDLKHQIYMKEEIMAVYLSQKNFDACDSLKCVMRTMYSKVRVTAHKAITEVYSKLDGNGEFAKDTRPPWEKPHGRKPHWRKPPFHPPPHGDHSHSNHTCPGKGNHTHHPFPHRPPPPPLCRCPPPPPPHGRPPHKPSEGRPGRRPHHPPHDGPGKPPADSPGRHPDHPGDRPHNAPPSPHPFPPSDELLDFESPSFDVPGSHSEFNGHRYGPKVHIVRRAAKFFVAFAVISLLFAVIHRRCCCSTSRRQEKQARREERHRRRAFRRAARKHAWRSWFARHVCRSTAHDDLNEEEKHAMLNRQLSDGEEDAVASEIGEFRNAVSVVSDMVAAEEGRMEGRISMDSRATLPEYMSDIGGERLPTYEDESGSELSTAVADGFRYTPGSSEYTPGNSESGSVRDVLGDVKE